MDGSFSFHEQDQDQEAAANARQRAEQRNSMFLQAHVIPVAGGDAQLLRVRNLSSGGLMAEGGRGLVRGAIVKIDLRGIDNIAGRVAWTTEDRIGIAFDAPIDPAEARRARPASAGTTMLLVKPSPESRRPPLRVKI
ncbi:PilZ domain-containing protein [Sphingomonas sp. 1P06PA]|uniref:PilZ domain-containing protein n=1 Tax=Sphingomonas sp. 1P06PA TaxID=554121 RepID=UPI0039A5FDAA